MVLRGQYHNHDTARSSFTNTSGRIRRATCGGQRAPREGPNHEKPGTQSRPHHKLSGGIGDGIDQTRFPGSNHNTPGAPKDHLYLAAQFVRLSHPHLDSRTSKTDNVLVTEPAGALILLVKTLGLLAPEATRPSQT